MHPIFVTILALLAALIASNLLIFLIQSLSNALFPLPSTVDPSDKGQLRRHIRQLPIGAFVLVELSYVLGSFVGGFVVATLVPAHSLFAAGGVGAVLTMCGVGNMMSIPHPVWFAVVSTASFVPCALLGGHVAG